MSTQQVKRRGIRSFLTIATGFLVLAQLAIQWPPLPHRCKPAKANRPKGHAARV
jgi:hypothetical protein